MLTFEKSNTQLILFLNFFIFVYSCKVQTKGNLSNKDMDMELDNDNQNLLLSGNNIEKSTFIPNKQQISDLSLQKVGQSQEEKVAILDFGAQYGKVIDRRVRECNVCSDILPFNTTMNELLQKGYKAIIISGGPNSVYIENAPKYDPDIFSGKLPLLGICYGFQLINKHFGGTVGLQPRREDGRIKIKIDDKSELFMGLSIEQFVLLTHGDGVTRNTMARGGFQTIAISGEFIAGIANIEKHIYGLQFHPEVDLTENGTKIFSNFLQRICHLKCNYSLVNRELQCIEYIRKTVVDQSVLVLCSGGVDSTVAAALCTKALGPEKVHAIHIDNGFMRLNESMHVINSLNALGLNVHHFNFVSEFLEGRIILDGIMTPPLKLVTFPEEKRKIIGDTFIRCKDIAINKLGLNNDIFLVQGTLRPDLIESASHIASGCADVIKTHHNDSALVRELRNLGKVVEPLQDFHKDEVRVLGHTLGLPEHIVHRHPFPGPGLAIRILCADMPFKDEYFEETQNRVRDIVKNYDCNFNAHLLPIKSVGVQGDRRTYSYVVALTSNYDDENIPFEKAEHLAQNIPNEIHCVNRVVYVFHLDNEAHSINEITITHINEGTLQILQKADNIVYQTLRGVGDNDQPNHRLKNVLNQIQQMPVVLIPVHFQRVFKLPQFFPSSKYSIVLRPFITHDFMTGQPAIPGKNIPLESIFEMVNRIEKEMPSTISHVMIDMTSKPPGTTEWE